MLLPLLRLRQNISPATVARITTTGTTTAMTMVVVLLSDDSGLDSGSALGAFGELETAVLISALLEADVLSLLDVDAVEALEEVVRANNISGPGRANVSLLGFLQSSSPLP